VTESDVHRSIRGRLGGLGLPLVVTAVAFALGYLSKLPCHLAGWPEPRTVPLAQYCYSDIPELFQTRALYAGVFPFSPENPQPLEYPVLTGIVMYLTARIEMIVYRGVEIVPAAQTYFHINVVLLLLVAMVTVAATWALLRRNGGRPSDALLVAASPSLIFAGTINWDLLVVALAGLALLAWAHDRPVLAGALIGLGTATKLYPLFILGPLLVLCARQGRMPAFWRATAAAVAAWLAANVPVAIAYPDGWLEFFRFNTDRPADFGAIWYAFELVGYPVPGLNVIAPLSFLLLCAGIGALAWYAPRPPTIEQLAFLVVTAFLVTNKVYSPQYVLWMLPLAVLARGSVPFPRVLRDFALWQAAELLYWATVWGYLEDRLYYSYALSIVLRLAVTVWFAGQVVHEIRSARAEPASDGDAEVAERPTALTVQP